MITLYSGTPGSGKSMNMARKMMDTLTLKKRGVISNMNVNMDVVTRKGRRRTGKFTYVTNDRLTVQFLVRYAAENHKTEKESQTLICIDEAAIMFNARSNSAFDRKAWIEFFQLHRHYGYDAILVSQNDRLIDPQLRAFIEYNVIHRKATNFGNIGFLLKILRIPLFSAVTVWYALKEKSGSEMFLYRRKYGRLYDTMAMYGDGQRGKAIGLGDGPDEENFANMQEPLTESGTCPACGAKLGSRQPAPAKAEAPKLTGDRKLEPIRRYVYDGGTTMCVSPRTYEEGQREVYSLKYLRRTDFAPKMALEMAEALIATGETGIDVVAWSPMTPSKERARGYNQAQLLAMQLARQLKVNFAPILQKTAETESQKGLGAEERLANLKGKITADPAMCAGKRVLLVDDVLTTGATMRECASALYEAGAREVGCCAYADARGRQA